MMVHPALIQPVRVKLVQVPFSGYIGTDASGYSSLANFRKRILSLYDQTIHLNWHQLNHLDANLSALLLAILRRAEVSNNLKFQLDAQSILDKQNVFMRNGLVAAIQGTTFLRDERQSTIPVRGFKIDEIDAFTNYIQDDMFRHHRLHALDSIIKDRIGSCFSELFCNVEIHSGTDEVFVCGQFFPKMRELRFTMVDVGCGFLHKIVQHTAGKENIVDAVGAVKWAISGNTTKTAAAGGSGLRNILQHCMDSSDSVHIATDGCYCQYDPNIDRGKIQIHNPINYVPGTTISTIFRNL